MFPKSNVKLFCCSWKKQTKKHPNVYSIYTALKKQNTYTGVQTPLQPPRKFSTSSSTIIRHVSYLINQNCSQYDLHSDWNLVNLCNFNTVVFSGLSGLPTTPRLNMKKKNIHQEKINDITLQRIYWHAVCLGDCFSDNPLEHCGLLVQSIMDGVWSENIASDSDIRRPGSFLQKWHCGFSHMIMEWNMKCKYEKKCAIRLPAEVVGMPLKLG